jgi:hypothetical protein
LPAKRVYGAALVTFVAGVAVWLMFESAREAGRPRFLPPPFKTGWKATEILTPSLSPSLPFPKAIVTGADAGSRFVLSTGKTVTLAGIVLDSGTPWSEEARKLATRLVERRQVFLEMDPADQGEDGKAYLYAHVPFPTASSALPPGYGRWSFNAELVRQGYARVEEREGLKHREVLLTLENEAKENRRGMWGTG